MPEPASIDGTGRYQTSIQISAETRDLLYALATRLGISRTDVIEAAIHTLGQTKLRPEKYAALLNPLTSSR